MGVSPQRKFFQKQSAGHDSGYTSGCSSIAVPPVSFTKAHLKFLNCQLSHLEPIDILRWAKLTIPNLYQTTAFGVTGLATLDMLSKIDCENPYTPRTDLIFLDTLYAFPETLDLVSRVQQKYPDITVHIYKPEGVSTAQEFESRHGERLWETQADLYDWIAKVEPAQRAYQDLNVSAVLTGRRRSQGGKRGDIDIIEIDEAGLVKINPLMNWSFQQVQQYIRDNNVPYNALLDQGYKSVGDWHSTQPIAEGEDERAGRWKGMEKSECGIHNKRSKYAQYLYEMEQKQQQKDLADALNEVTVESDGYENTDTDA